jgi:vesicle coat complex subunit
MIVLLCIKISFQDPNQLIRASALRVLSSIRVPTIVSIMMLAIREAVNDMSAYVRKTAANAIAKLYAYVSVTLIILSISSRSI